MVTCRVNFWTVARDAHYLGKSVSRNFLVCTKRLEFRCELPIAVRVLTSKIDPVPDTIEAEVLEIDGSPPPAPDPKGARSAQGAGMPWDSLRGKVLTLDRRWWPLWVLLGLVALALVLTVGVVVAAIVIVAKIVGGILRFLLGSPSRGSGSSLSRRSF